MVSQDARRPLILVVDDDAAMCAMLRRALETFDFEVATATDGNAAIDAIGARRPDLVLTDIYMPGSDGFQLVKWIASQPDAIPVVAMSGGAKTGFDQLAAAEHLGARALIDKPFRASQLIETIERVLGGRPIPPRDRRQR
jgi:CheY-like chemotaxis protein